MGNSTQSIGLLGGSFDPVHNGHLAIAKSFLNSGFISELWILLTPDPPHKTDRPQSDYNLRLKMLRAAFSHYNQVQISEIENQLPQPSYTVQTVRKLKQKHPDTIFFLCVGEDSAKDFQNWKDWKTILEYCELLVARRNPKKEIELHPEIAEKTHFVPHQPIAISSTMVRDRIAEGADVSSLIPPDVETLIKTHTLYKN